MLWLFEKCFFINWLMSTGLAFGTDIIGAPTAYFANESTKSLPFMLTWLGVHKSNKLGFFCMRMFLTSVG